MRAIPHHPLRFALLALLVLQIMTVAVAQTPDTSTQWREVTSNLYGPFSDAGFGAYECGYTGLCAVGVDVSPDFGLQQLRELVEATLLANNVDLATVEWDEGPDGFSATWRLPDGAFSITAIAPEEIEIWWAPDDPCADWYDIDPFEFAATASGRWSWQGAPRIAECVGFDHQDEFGQTPLIYAITAGNVYALEDVLRYSDPNHRTLAGWTPLMYAARLEGYLASEFVNQLLAAGADPTARAPDGTSVASLAAANPNLDAATRAALLPPPAIDPTSRRIAEVFLRQNDEVSGGYNQYQREVGCGLLPDRPDECFLVTRTRPIFTVSNGAMLVDAVIVVTVTFHEGLDLIDRFGYARAYELITAAPQGRQCQQRFESAGDANVDWTVRADGTLHLHYTSGPLQPHGDDRTPPRGAQALGPLCD